MGKKAIDSADGRLQKVTESNIENILKLERITMKDLPEDKTERKRLTYKKSIQLMANLPGCISLVVESDSNYKQYHHVLSRD